MIKLRGVYAYPVHPDPSDLIEDPGMVVIDKVTEDPETYRNHPEPEKVNFLVLRQGVVNDVLKYFPNVRWLQLLNAGFEKVDLEELKKRDIIFTNARSVYCATIAEDVIAKILFLARNYGQHFRDQQKHFWPDDDQLPNYNIDLCGRTLGILGAGAIGREIALRARVFGLNVHGYDPYIREKEGFEVIYSDKDGLKKLLSESDFVVTSLPVTEETKDIMNAGTFAMMKRTAFLINVARGAIIDEAALIDALNKGVIAGAALDVTKTEPLPEDDPLWAARNIMITPHRAAYGDKMSNKMCSLIQRNIKHYLNGEPMEDRIL